MIGDVFTTLQDGANPTLMAGVEPRLSADSIDLLAAKDVGAGTTVRAEFFTVVTIVANATSTTVEFQIVACDDDAGLNPVVVATSGPVAKATLTAGRAPVEAKFNHIYGSIVKRFLKARYVSNDGADMTSGSAYAKVAVIIDSGDGGKPYPSGFVVAT